MIWTEKDLAYLNIIDKMCKELGEDIDTTSELASLMLGRSKKSCLMKLIFKFSS